MQLQTDDGTYNNPLDWWRGNEHRFPLLASVALRVLAIPASSVPSERVFSAAGLTIAKDGARLDPENANELVFLHEALPALRNYEKGCNLHV